MSKEIKTYFDEAKKEMDRRIKDAVVLAVEEFRKKTGYAPKNINIEMLDSSSIESDRANYVVGRVGVEVVL